MKGDEMLRRDLLAIAIILLATPAAFAQTAAGSVRQGNSLYQEGKFDEALKKYQAAQVESPDDKRIMLNLGDAQYRLENHEDALSEYLRAADGAEKELAEHSHYNAGNALYRAGRLEDAIEQYQKALEIEPDDEDAKYNLEFVRREIRRRQEQQQQRQEQQQQKKDQEQQQQEDKNSSGNDKQQEQNQQPGENQRQQPQEKPQQNQKDSNGNNSDQREPSPKEEQKQQSEGSQQASVSEKNVSDENMERWLDAVEAESAENMKDFFKRQQPNQEISNPEDW